MLEFFFYLLKLIFSKSNKIRQDFIHFIYCMLFLCHSFLWYHYAEKDSQTSPTTSTLPRTACSELCRGGTTVRSPKLGTPLDSYAGVAAIVGAFLAIAIRSIWPARTASASTIAATSPWLMGDGIDCIDASSPLRDTTATISSTKIPEATEALLPSDLLVAPNLAMLTVDFSIRLAPMVRR